MQIWKRLWYNRTFYNLLYLFIVILVKQNKDYLLAILWLLEMILEIFST